MIFLVGAPNWAQGGICSEPGTGACRVSPTDLADFATATARRYSGARPGTPRVRYWQIWNEPNLDFNLRPQFEGGEAVSPEAYRDLLNASAAAIHRVRADNRVIAGALSPFGGNMNDPIGGHVNQVRVRPLQFMREMFCMSRGAKPKSTCRVKLEFDIWAHHPYTYGGPTRKAYHPDDSAIGNLGEMRDFLAAARKLGKIKTRGAVDFWATEFSYDSQPADPKGLPLPLHTRWVSEALYRMWAQGVTHVNWWLLRDGPFPQDMNQSGLYFRAPDGIASDVEKPALRAFRFPFVAFRNKKDKSVEYWGRSPSSARAKIVVEQKAGSKWKPVLRLTTNKYGIFQGKLKSVQGGSLRARLANNKDYSHGFSLKPVKDFRFCPWGSFC